MDEKIKIVFVAASTVGGGAERVQLNIMNSLDSNFYDINFINIGTETAPKELKNHIHYSRYHKKHVRQGFFPLKKDLKKIKPDYLFTTSILAAYLLQVLKVILRLKSKVIVRIAVPPSESPHRTIKYRVLNRINKFVLKHVDLIIAQTQFMKDDVVNHFKLNPEKVQVIRNIVDSEFLSSKSEEFVPEEYDKTHFNIVAVGALYPVKGFDLLIEALASVKNEIENLRLYILGDVRYAQDYDKVLERLISQYSLEENVFLLGHKSNPFPYIKHANLFVLSSRSEGFPNVVLESLYLKTPVIATSCVDFTGVIEEGENGYVVEKNSTEALAKGILNGYTRLRQPKFHEIKNFDYSNVFKGQSK